MATQPIFCGRTVFEVSPERYTELCAKEHELLLLRNALSKVENYGNIEPIKKYFGIIEEKNDAEK